MTSIVYDALLLLLYAAIIGAISGLIIRAFFNTELSRKDLVINGAVGAEALAGLCLMIVGFNISLITIAALIGGICWPLFNILSRRP